MCTTPPLTLPFDNASVIIFAYCCVSIGAGTVAYVPRIRRGTTIGGTVINAPASVVCTAGNITLISLVTVDTGSIAGTPQYSFTLSGNGTTGVWGGPIDLSIVAFAL